MLFRNSQAGVDNTRLKWK